MRLHAMEFDLGSAPDERLVALAGGGVEAAFSEIVTRYRAELHLSARRLSSEERAEDLVQQTFLSAFVAFRGGAEVGHLRGWLHQILRNTAIRAASRRRIEVQLDGSMSTSEPLEDAVQRRMRAHAMLAEVASLPARQRRALVATALHGHSCASVAGTMGMSEGAVRQLMRRARVSLRTAVQAIAPLPLIRWVTAGRSSPAARDAVGLGIAAGGASAGGAAVKFGALLVSGVVATSVVGPPLVAPGHPRERPSSHQSTPGARSGQPSGGPASAGAPLPAAGLRRVAAITGAGARHRSAPPSAPRRRSSGAHRRPGGGGVTVGAGRERTGGLSGGERGPATSGRPAEGPGRGSSNGERAPVTGEAAGSRSGDGEGGGSGRTGGSSSDAGSTVSRSAGSDGGSGDRRGSAGTVTGDGHATSNGGDDGSSAGDSSHTAVTGDGQATARPGGGSRSGGGDNSSTTPTPAVTAAAATASPGAAPGSDDGGSPGTSPTARPAAGDGQGTDGGANGDRGSDPAPTPPGPGSTTTAESGSGSGN